MDTRLPGRLRPGLGARIATAELESACGAARIVRACGSAGCGHRADNRRTFGPIPRWARHDHAGDCHDQHGRTALNDLIESAFPRPGGARIGFGAQRMRLGLRSTAVLPGWPGTSTRRPGPQTPIPATAISVRLCHPATASTRATGEHQGERGAGEQAPGHRSHQVLFFRISTAAVLQALASRRSPRHRTLPAAPPDRPGPPNVLLHGERYVRVLDATAERRPVDLRVPTA